MEKYPGITERRIEQFIKEFIEPRLWLKNRPLKVEMFYMGVEEYKYRTPQELQARLPGSGDGSEAMQEVQQGFKWGPVWSTAWFHLTGSVPEEWAGETIALNLDPGVEAIVWEDGVPSQGIDWAHRSYPLLESAKGGETVDLWVEAYGGNPNVSVHGKPKEPSPTPFTIGENNVSVFDKALWALHWDFKIGFDLMTSLPEDEPRRGQLRWALNEIVNLCVSEFPPLSVPANPWQPGDPPLDMIEEQQAGSRFVASPQKEVSPEARTRYRDAIQKAREILGETLYKPASASAHQMSAMGHAHIDTAWLWPLWVTQRKCAHTFSTATRFMDFYPDYKFVCSQAAQYEWVKEQHPQLFERIKGKVKSGQWEPTGSMWVEADCNLASGESLVRQFLYGKRFFMQELGVETKDMFLPDVFGYAASLPQILRKCRIDYFVTQKISWNQTNRFPHHSFLWQGIDGSQVLSHFPPVDTYNAMMNVKELLFNVRNYREHDRSEHSLYLYGFGDGGGGPTIEMLENMKRFKSVESLPTVTPEYLGTFFDKLVGDYWDNSQKTQSENLEPYYLKLPPKKLCPVWAGELYLELHRGTYTSQARNKMLNRKAELALRDAEFLWCVIPGGLKDYPQEKLERAWKTVLLNQFHDIIPGSSIQEVYRDSEKDYQEVFAVVDELLESAMARLAENIGTGDMKQPVLVVNNHGTLDSLARFVTEETLPESDQIQKISTPEGDAYLSIIAMGEETSYGYHVFDAAFTEEADALEDEEPLEILVSADTNRLENEWLLLEFDQNGLLSRVFDKLEEREVLLPGTPANVFQFFDDRPLFWDAWDIDPFYVETLQPITQLDSAEVVENGPLRAAIKQVRSFGDSKITQTIRLRADSALIEFDTEVDWQEESKMLKVAFPVAINSTRASYEIQYGHVERPTHHNTSWDAARFEVCAHKWVDLSEGGYGVALLNDCKYGHDVTGSTLRLTLLRAPVAPDPTCDRGNHRFTYALLPHMGDLREGGVIEEAYQLNAPARTRALKSGQTGELPASRSFFALDRDGIILESVKKAEDEEAIIVRLYDAYNARGVITLSTSLPVREAFVCDMLEDDLTRLEVNDGEISLQVNPFEIVTLKLRLQA